MYDIVEVIFQYDQCHETNYLSITLYAIIHIKWQTPRKKEFSYPDEQWNLPAC